MARKQFKSEQKMSVDYREYDHARRIDAVAKQVRERGRHLKREPIQTVGANAATILRSFSVIFLAGLGFNVSGDQLTITCSKCACTYTADEMENETDDELNERHRTKDPRCKVLGKIFSDYQGRLRLPGARAPVRQSYQPFYLQPGPIYSYSYSLPAAVTVKQAQFQDDIISDSLPGMKFTGSGPSSRTSNEGLSTVSGSSTSTSAAYAEYKHRLESFGTNWKNRAKKNSRPTPESLAEAGLYEYPQERKDAVRCFACEVVLYGWKGGNEDVWTKHAQMSPSCPHVLAKKGKEFVDAALAQKTRRPATKQNLLDLNIDAKWVKTVTEMGFSLDDFLLVALYKQFLEPEKPAIFTDIQEPIHWILYKKAEAEKSFPKFESKWPKDESSQGRDNSTDDGEIESDSPAPIKYEETQCKICFSAGANMLLKPCNHLISCENCTRRLKNCPVCRKPIMGVTKLTFD